MELDELRLKLSTWWLKSFVTNIAKHAISSKVGIDTDISLNDLDVEMRDGVVKAHLDIDMSLSQHEFM